MTSKTEGVGYKQPPKQHQWKKGQSGNPSGKKKRAAVQPKPLVACLAEKLSEPVEIVVNGEPTTMTIVQALGSKMIHEMINASLKDKIAALKAFEQLGVFQHLDSMIENGDEQPAGGLSEENRRILAMISQEVLGVDETA